MALAEAPAEPVTAKPPIARATVDSRAATRRRVRV